MKTRAWFPRLVRVPRAIGVVLGPIPGWYMLLVEPLAMGLTGIERVRQSGAEFELHLDEFVQRKFYFRSFERRELRFLARWLREGDRVVDVGANVGLLALCAGHSVGPTGAVLAVEPIPLNLGRLRANIKLNPRLNIEVLEMALSDDVGTLRLGLSEHQASVGNDGSYSSLSSAGGVDVAQTTLDRAVAEWLGEQPRLRLVKLDIEGMEGAVVRGGESVLDGQATDAVMLEVNPLYSADLSALKELKERGYVIHRLGSLGRVQPWTSWADIPHGSEQNEQSGGAIRKWLRGQTRLITAIAIAPSAAKSK